ncbi:type II toxin-antitoxin system RelE/ParE family toxin [uncultured Cyclobacterium sp.]|uniref:type II toxin-antitoxin system RelE/ParE family toxin n=1 Tax=uncultured Cyclobacterium sp. TaxID=453820 RepID=UPI0030EC6413|tara:strand:- start:418 stop:732 length:315 start_codon:yes stop_codon:yes gene_type:complete
MAKNFNVRYNPRIYLDIQKAVDFYTEQTQSHELGKRFINNVETALLKLNNAALQYEVRYDDIRLLPIPSFPYRAHFRVDEKNDKVFVEAIFHTKQNPEKWRTKT